MATKIDFKPIGLTDVSKYAAVKRAAEMPKKAEDFTYSSQFLGAWLKYGITSKVLKKAMVYEREMWAQGLPEGMTLTTSCTPIFKGKALVNVRSVALDFLDSETLDKHFIEEEGAEFYFVGTQGIKGLYEEKGEVDFLIIVNRELDRLTYLQAGYENVVLVPDYAELNWINESVIGILSKVKIFILAFTNDRQGITLRDEISRRIGKEKCKLAAIGAELIGVNDFISSSGPYKSIKDEEKLEKIKHTIASAKPLQISGIFIVSDFNAELNDLYKKGYPEGFKTGKAAIDKGMTIFTGCFSLLTGTPGTGKSTLLKSLYPRYQEQATISGKYLKMGMYSAEDKSEAMAFAKLIQIKTGKYVTPHDNQLTEYEFMAAKEWLRENFILIRPQGLDEWLKQRNITRANTLDGILMYAEVCVIMYGMNWLVIDNWATIEKDYKKGENQDVYTGNALNKLAEFGTKFNCHVTLVAHPTKTEIDAHGNFKRLTLYNVNGSSHFYNFPDLGIILQRDRYRLPTQDESVAYYEKHKKELAKGVYVRDFSLPTEVIIDKVREDWMGSLGSFNAYMDTYRGKTFVFSKDELHRSAKGVDTSNKITEKESQLSFLQDVSGLDDDPPF